MFTVRALVNQVVCVSMPHAKQWDTRMPTHTYWIKQCFPLSVPHIEYPPPLSHPSIRLPACLSLSIYVYQTEIQTFISKYAQWTSVTISARFTWETHRPRLTFVTSWTWQASRPNRSWHTWGTRWSFFTLHQATTNTVKVTGAYTQLYTSVRTLTNSTFIKN